MKFDYICDHCGHRFPVEADSPMRRAPAALYAPDPDRARQAGLERLRRRIAQLRWSDARPMVQW